jgi:hypothetical protein
MTIYIIFASSCVLLSLDFLNFQRLLILLHHIHIRVLLLLKDPRIPISEYCEYFIVGHMMYFLVKVLGF